MTTPSELPYKVGDTVHLHEQFTKATRAGTATGTIVKIGRTLVHVQATHELKKYRRDGQELVGPWSGHFCTIEQHRRHQEIEHAHLYLLSQGVELSLSCELTSDQRLELAAYVRAMVEENNGTQEHTLDEATS